MIARRAPPASSLPLEIVEIGFARGFRMHFRISGDADLEIGDAFEGRNEIGRAPRTRRDAAHGGRPAGGSPRSATMGADASDPSNRARRHRFPE